ncbi:MAG: hypothetical protein ACI8WW_002491 [Oceanospirillaceae bacterium]|jgi:hypothetical protein
MISGNIGIAEIEQLIKKYGVAKSTLIDYKMYALTHHSLRRLKEVRCQDKTTENKPFEHHLMVADYFAAIKYVWNKQKSSRN